MADPNEPVVREGEPPIQIDPTTSAEKTPGGALRIFPTYPAAVVHQDTLGEPKGFNAAGQEVPLSEAEKQEATASAQLMGIPLADKNPLIKDLQSLVDSIPVNEDFNQKHPILSSFSLFNMAKSFGNSLLAVMRGNPQAEDMMNLYPGMSVASRFYPVGSLGVFGSRLSPDSMIKQRLDAALDRLPYEVNDPNASPTRILKDTGLSKDYNGNWVLEVNDSNAKLAAPISVMKEGAIDPSIVDLRYQLRDGTAKLPEILNHPELFDAFPYLKDVGVFATKSKDELGVYDHINNRIGVNFSQSPNEILKTLLHESQHVVNLNEFRHGVDRPLGESTEGIENRYASMLAVVNKMAADGNIKPEEAVQLQNYVTKMKSAYDLYHAAPGEVEARNVEARIGLSETERREIPPEATMDVPLEGQVDLFQFHQIYKKNPEEYSASHFDQVFAKKEEKPDELAQVPFEPEQQTFEIPVPGKEPLVFNDNGGLIAGDLKGAKLYEGTHALGETVLPDTDWSQSTWKVPGGGEIEFMYKNGEPSHAVLWGPNGEHVPLVDDIEFPPAPAGSNIKPKEEITPTENLNFEELRNQWADKIKSLSVDEEDAIKDYTGVYFRDINKTLLGHEAFLDSPIDRIYLAIEALDSALSKSYLPNDMTLYRSISPNVAKQLDDLGPGDIWPHIPFASTSVSADFAKDFKQGTILEIHAPKGSNGLYVDPISSNPGEHEVLLPRDSYFKIIEKKSNHVVLELQSGRK